MCFTVEDLKRGKIAKSDIVCWKAIRKDNTPVYRWVHGSRTEYVLNKPSRRVKIVVMGMCTMTIDGGYHSAKENIGLIDAAIECSESITKRDLKVRKFIIPKGTRYFENRTQYVSETIILVEP